jgi:hypothetical protein
MAMRFPEVGKVRGSRDAKMATRRTKKTITP